MEKLLEMLQSNGYDAEIIPVDKPTGGAKKGLRIAKGSVGKIYYEVDESDYERVVNDFENSEWVNEEYLINELKDKNNLILCIRKPKKDDVIARPFLDLELYVRSDIEFGTIAINKDNLKELGLTEDELFEIATENSRRMLQVKNLIEMIAGENAEGSPVTLTTNGGYLGASAMVLLEDVFKDCPFGFDVRIIPSSIHEVILFDASELTKEQIEDMNNFIKEVNKNELNEEEVLSDHLYTLKDGKVGMQHFRTFL